MNKKLAGVLCGIATVVGIVAYIHIGPNTSDVFDPKFEEGQIKVVNEAGVSPGIQIPGYSSIIASHGNTTLEGDFFNPDENDVYFEIIFYLPQEELEIYRSNLISPGQHLYQIELDEIVDKGTYEMSIIYNTFSMDDNFTPKNGATVTCDFIVE